MREPETTVINGAVYDVTPLPAGKGLAVMHRLIKAVGPSIGKLAGKDSEGQLMALLGSALVDITDRLSAEDLTWVCKTLAEGTLVTVGDRQIALHVGFDKHFAGEYLALGEWLKFALGVNFGPLFDALGKRAKPVPSIPAR